ncbi:transposase [Streptomyces bacillaris]
MTAPSSESTVPAATRDFDAGKKVKGRQRSIVTDTLGLPLAVHVVGASIQGRDGTTRPLLWTRFDHPGVKKIQADQGFADTFTQWPAQILSRDLKIARKDPTSADSKYSPSGGR